MKIVKLLFIIFSIVIFQSCHSVINYSHESKGYKIAYDHINLENLKTNLYVITDDDMEGRNTGSSGQKKAGNFMINQYKKNGIGFPAALGSYYQKVPSSSMKKYGVSLPDSENILAFIEGSEYPNEVIIISAHYDHIGTKNGVIYNGADDDGSGTVAVLEIAKAFQIAKKNGYSPKRSILFLHFTGEEHGLLGSEYYTENPVFPLSNTITNLNIDMIGRDDYENKGKQYVYVIGSGMLSSELKKINIEANRKTVNLELNYKYDDPNDTEQLYYRSDHYNFAKHNIPIVFFFDGIHEDYHKPTDDADKIDYPLLQKRTKLIFATAWELVNRSKRIKVDQVIKKKYVP